MTWTSYRLSGYAPDLPPDALPPDVWSSVTNILFREGVAERAVGDYDVATTGTPVTRYDWVHPLTFNGGANTGLVYGGRDIAGPTVRLGTYAVGIGHVDVTPGAWGTAGAPNQWTGGALSTGVLVGVATQRPVWVSNAGAVTLLAPSYIYSAVRPYKYMAVGIGDSVTAGARNTVRWSASVVPGAAPNTWTPAAGNDAGSFDVSNVNAGSFLVDGGRLGEDFMIYADTCTQMMTYVGGATVMAARSVHGSVGALARNCWADLGVGHLLVAQDDVVLVNQGGVAKSLVDGRLRRTMFAGVFTTAGRAPYSHVWHDTQRGLVFVNLPGGANIDAVSRSFVYSIADDRWGNRDIYDSNTTADNTTTSGCTAEIGNQTPGFAQRRLLVARRGSGATLASSQCYWAESDTPVTGVMQDSELVKADLDLGDANTVKLVRGIRIRGTATATVTLKVSIGTKFAADEAYTYSAEQDYVLPTSQRADFLVTGRWISVKIRCPGPMRAVKVMGFDLDVQGGALH